MIVPLIIVAAAVCSAGALAYKERDVICDYVEHKLMERRLRKRASAVPASYDRDGGHSDSDQATQTQTHTSQSQVHLHSAVGSEEPHKDDYTEEIEMSFRRRNKRGTSIGSDKTVGSSDPSNSYNSFHMPEPPQSDTQQYWSSSSQSSDTSGSVTQNRRGYPRQTYGHGHGQQRAGARPASIVSEQPSLSYSANSHGESTWGSSASDISSDYDFADERTSSEGENVVVVDPSAPSLYEYHDVNTP
ncbi:hypothetical protein B0I72DRAFT_143282 [Yarrowia lipolytica]|uniref:YALI0B11748p n=2 Tax=Yarrowia lipolytica TaxID=4952 RepID=Q6CEZ0_YARLI|nr:YALI0B11748p [Yarrowia lipolytica CLIB122]AOW01567.1 hypothetical protein YALI1_B15560g [Yarrowia lipolytica]KAB8281896.1 hypothetical protein BKA91DRAFT_139491 [Yarrowia lipolytica]KAE8169711.1 hypothetical protein BKA90DRAFT_142185 [Yarrowia lipolytica]KAJ8052382.1 hypothetical protein LXG23DRAFT_25159 [Yarrowia lipolytica]QNP97201.1 Hypothetical protein YALI2_C00854g [Yarrowia lipolytica]|eukprot:XP_500772.1 YALI0B11748p [Yarrowia lipolytica CLIB122]